MFAVCNLSFLSRSFLEPSDFRKFSSTLQFSFLIIFLYFYRYRVNNLISLNFGIFVFLSSLSNFYITVVLILNYYKNSVSSSITNPHQADCATQNIQKKKIKYLIINHKSPRCSLKMLKKRNKLNNTTQWYHCGIKEKKINARKIKIPEQRTLKIKGFRRLPNLVDNRWI